MAAEIANLIEGIPCGHLQVNVILHVRDSHGDVEQMLFRMRKGYGVLDLGASRNAGQRSKDKETKSRAQPETKLDHRALTPAVECVAASFFRSFSQRPSKLPLDIISRRSPGLASATSTSAMASAPGRARASLPSCRTDEAT